MGSCTFDTGGERRFAERLEEKLEDDYLCWFNLSFGGSDKKPDFVIFHPRRGLLVLEVKDWKINTIHSADAHGFLIHTESGLKSVKNPLTQAMKSAHHAQNRLEKDAQLRQKSGVHQGALQFPCSFGVVFPNLKRAQFAAGDLGEIIPPHLVICQDEMSQSVDAEAFQARLWAMLHFLPSQILSLPQIDRVRGLLYPEIRLPQQGELVLENQEDAPDKMRVMDLQQEQLARSLRDGHRVIHGVAGSGKTLILGCRAEQLAQMVAKPILILCYNKTLAKRLDSTMRAKNCHEKVHVFSFHQWCRKELLTFNIGLPPDNQNVEAFFAEMVNRLIRAVDGGQIPRAQYDALMIDEAHDFRPEWLKLVVQMVDPQTNSVLVLYDDAQSIYNEAKEKKFSFKSVGIEARGRTTILNINYRNTEAILRFARDIAASVLSPSDADEDSIPLLKPQSFGQAGKTPQIIKLPSVKDEAKYIAEALKSAHKEGLAWRDMAIIYRQKSEIYFLEKCLQSCGIPLLPFAEAQNENADKVMLITMHSSKGLEFPLVVIPDFLKKEAAAQINATEAKLLYVAMTRATQILIPCGVGN